MMPVGEGTSGSESPASQSDSLRCHASSETDSDGSPPQSVSSPGSVTAAEVESHTRDDPNSNLFKEEHLDRLREDNRRRLQENANLLKQAEAGLRRHGKRSFLIS